MRLHPARPARADTPRPARGSKPRRVLVSALACGLGVAMLWGGAASYYLLFRDDLIARFVAQQRAMQAAYDARVGELQEQVERAASERLLSRDGLEDRLAALAERQELLEKRQGQLAGLTVATTSSIPGTLPPKPAPRVRGPMPTPNLPELRMHGEDRADVPDQRYAASMAGLELRLDELAGRQMRVVSSLAAEASRNADRLRSMILQAGLRPARFEKRQSGIGGPLVPVNGDAFDIAIAEAQRATSTEEHLRRTIASLPFRKPLREAFAYSSDFGMRLDPFTRGLAMHTGIDMRADYGAMVRATAAGRVTAAEPSGGYGNMVEVDHGHGLATRYAHMSSYVVSPGQWVEAGAILGRVGSTGRSTGNHLHYETRIDGEPVDPQPFLRVAESPDLEAISD